MPDTPYSAEQIRKASPQGRCYRFQVFEGDTYRVAETRFLEVDERGATVIQQTLDRHGNPVASPVTEYVTWEALRQHAAFPGDRATVEPGEVECGMGRHRCAIYTVRGETPSAPSRVFYFADTRPGPPVRVLEKTGAAETLLMEMISDEIETGS